jgi:hypothetical protein
MRGANQGTPPSLSHPADMATMLRQSTPEKIDANSSMSLNVNPSPICGHRHCRGVAWRGGRQLVTRVHGLGQLRVAGEEWVHDAR